MSKGFQNGAKVDATKYHKSMPKYVSNKIMKIIENHIFLKGKNMQIHSTLVFEGVAGCVREREMYQQSIKHETKFHPQIDKHRCENDA